MPTSQPEMERRITQNSNDIVSVYDLLSGIDAQLAKHTIQLSNLGARLEAHDSRFDTLDSRFDALESRVGARLDSLDTGVAEVLRRLPE